MDNHCNNKTPASVQNKNDSVGNPFFSVLSMLRPKQWTKNLLVFAGLIFSYSIFQVSALKYSIAAFIVFCLLSGCSYILNDIIDLREDRLHPRKKHRPLAAGRIEIRTALLVLAVLLAFAVTLAGFINARFFVLAVLYFSLTTAYSLWLKNIVIIDVFSISLGFLLRALAGAVAIRVYISPWFLICALLLSLFLALTKRRQEIVNLEFNGVLHRKVLEHYPIHYLDQLISIVTASTILGYSLYTFTAGHSELLMLTIPFVIYGIFRYLYLVHKKNLGESPDEIFLNDKPLLINIFLWVLTSIIILSLEYRGLI